MDQGCDLTPQVREHFCFAEGSKGADHSGLKASRIDDPVEAAGLGDNPFVNEDQLLQADPIQRARPSRLAR